MEERLIEVHRDESTGQRVFRIEQACIEFAYWEVEVLQQHAVVEQQLYVVVFLLKAAKLVGTLSLDVIVLARLLLDEQSEISSHQVDTPLQAKPFADKRRLEDGRVTRIASRLSALFHSGRSYSGEQLGDNLLDIGGLIGGCLLVVFLLVQIGTGAIVECLLAEVSTEGLLPVIRAIAIDDVVEHTAGEVTQQQCLRVGIRRQAANGIAQRMMAVALKAVGNRADIDEVVWLHDDKGWKQRGDIARLFLLAVEQVELHALLDDLLQILQMRSTAVNHDRPAIGIILVYGCVDAVTVDVVDQATHITIVDVPVFGLRFVNTGNATREQGGHRCVEDGADEECQRTTIVEHILWSQWLGAVAVATHLLDGHHIGSPDVVLLAEVVDLREKVTEGDVRRTQRLLAAQHQRFMHQAVGRHAVGKVQNVGNPCKQVGGSDMVFGSFHGGQ